ncbi:MAG: LemA family protein [Patescibacteria group bacterium]|nr:LemA family protein [Patescibacteria group bacterium]
MTLSIILVLVLVIGGFLVGIYNGLVKLKNKVEEAWSDIDVQLKRRYNLIPNLLETVKGYATHEKSVFKEVTEARSQAMQASTPADRAKAENGLQGALKSLFAVAESYPELKANENFLDLQKQLAETEDKIQNSRRYYNGNVRDFNTKIQIFPNNLVSPMFGFKKYDFFEIANAKERENVKVKF